MMVWKCPPLHLPNWSNHWKWKQEMKPHETGTDNPIDFPKQTNKYDAHKESIKGKILTADELADAMDTKGFRYREVKAAVKMLRQFGLAESIIKQQQLEIQALKDEVAKWKMSYENNIRFEDGYGHN